MAAAATPRAVATVRRRRAARPSPALWISSIVLGPFGCGRLGVPSSGRPRAAASWPAGVERRQRRTQRRPHLARAVETILGRLAERAQADRLQLGADRRMRRRRQRRIGDVLHRHVVGAVAVERRPPRQHVIEDDAGRIDVAASIGLLAARLFGRHVSGRADQRAVHRRPRAARLAAAAVALDRAQRGDAEVAHLRELGRLAVIAGRREDHDVVGLEIAVDDLHVVRHRDRRQHLRHEVDDARVAERPLLGDDVVKRPPLDVFHRQVEQRFVDRARSRTRARSSDGPGATPRAPRA